MRKLLLALAAGTALVWGSTAANAAVVVANPNVLTPPASGTFGSGMIVNPNPGGATFAFSDTIPFTIGGTASAVTDSSLITFLLNGSQNVDFTCQTCSLYIDTNAGANKFVQTQFDPMAEAWQLNPIVLAPGLHTIFANGTVTGPTGSYAGTLNVQAVPEPGTWALMILGFGVIGLSLRSRRRQTALAQVA